MILGQRMDHECFSDEDISSVELRPGFGRGIRETNVSYGFSSKMKCVPVGE